MNTPTFSVIIPAFNAMATLRSTVQSVLDQSFADFEVIIVDDGSLDKTARLAVAIASEDRRVRTILCSNGGVSKARNIGTAHSKGRLLAFLDADDQWAADKLAHHHIAHTRAPALNASFARVEFCSDQPGAMSAGRTVSSVATGHLSIADVVVENPICTTSNFVITREAFQRLGGFDETLRYAEDQEILVRLVSHGGALRGIDEPLVRYRMNENGLSCDFEAMLDGWRSFAGAWLSAQELAQAEATYCRYLARRALRSGADMSVARRLASRGLKADRDGFMSAGPRSFLTLGGVFAGGAMPAALRRRVFA